ncbi:MAG TPA: hypothetical protein VMI75_39405, partial [Polyangiaceae bacterium]|nr:hypothetical protein [Polyangiaceae bacterium]
DGGRTTAPEATRAFEVPGASKPEGATPADSATAPATAQTEGAASGAWGAFRSGAIDLNGYLDRKVDDATAHLGQMPAADLARVRAALRERLATDPTLVDLVKSATGSAPRVPDDD